MHQSLAVTQPSASGGQKPAEQLTDDELANMPRVKNLFNQFWKEKMMELNNGENRMAGRKGEFIKSPSNMTIYAPALNRSPVNKTNARGIDTRMVVRLQPKQINTHVEMEVPIQNSVESEELLVNVDNIVSDFVDSVRIEQRREEIADLQEKERRRASVGKDNAEIEDARTRADKAVVEAEKFRANIAAPDPSLNLNLSGHGEIHRNQVETLMLTQPVSCSNNLSSNIIPNIGVGVSDDNFFHLTCHIDPNLIHKIEKGEFVELEKLLPKDKLGGKGDENRLEWVQRDGGTFLVPAQRDSKIASFRRWEQAFRVYATIYCSANPQGAKEIWQYITVINAAASSYIWDNVYNYNITFRQLMAFNPNRSWVVTYNQMWNLSMRDPIPKGVQIKGLVVA